MSSLYNVPPAGVWLFINIPLGLMGLKLYSHRSPLQQVINLLYMPPNRGL